MIITLLEQIINQNLNDYIIKVIKSNRPDLCDYQCDDAFKLAKTLKKAPIIIANEIVDKINKVDNFNNYFKEIVVVNPGFINIKVSDKLINECIKKMNDDNKFGIKKPEKIETYFLDYGGPNVAKPLHVGHLRSAVVGESIKRIIDFYGHKTISDVHLGDYGLQIGQVIYGIIEDNINYEDITLEYLENTYPKISGICKENEEIKNKCAEITKKLQENDPYYTKLWKKILEISGNDIKRIYKYLDINFDLWMGESDAYPFIPTVTKMLEEKGILEISEGAKIINVKKETDKVEIPPLIYQKSNGAYLYGTTDMATAYQRIKDYNPDHLIYITDLRQNLHFTQVFRSCDKANLLKEDNYEFCGFGTVNGTDGKPYKTRSGDAPKLDSLFNQIEEFFINSKETNKEKSKEDIDIIVNSIIKFADLQNNRERDYIFDIDKFSSVTGKTGPYILYTYLRFNKIINSEGVTLKDITNKIYNEVDRNLRLKIIEFELAINNAFNEKMPHHIADYVYELCVLANIFYQNNHISNLDDKEIKNDWLYILNLTNRMIKQSLNLLGIKIPSTM